MMVDALDNSQFIKLSDDELMEVDGGFNPFAVALLLCLLGAGMYAYGYGHACRWW